MTHQKFEPLRAASASALDTADSAALDSIGRPEPDALRDFEPFFLPRVL